MCYVYVLKCTGGSLYTGYTPDLVRRMRAHISGKGGHYTCAHPPEELAGVWQCDSETGARRLEYAIKHKLDRAGKEHLLQNPETVVQIFPQLAGYCYTPAFFISLKACLEDQLHG